MPISLPDGLIVTLRPPGVVPLVALRVIQYWFFEALQLTAPPDASLISTRKVRDGPPSSVSRATLAVLARRAGDEKTPCALRVAAEHRPGAL